MQNANIKDLNKSENDNKQKNSRFFMIYTISLFIAALVLILISAVIQQKYNNDAITNYEKGVSSMEAAAFTGRESVLSLQDERDLLLLEINDLMGQLVEKDNIIIIKDSMAKNKNIPNLTSCAFNPQVIKAIIIVLIINLFMIS
jgi:hypothetical protein